jgi:predicted RNA-binding protein with PUA domain
VGDVIDDIRVYNPDFVKELDAYLVERVPELPKAEKLILANQMTGAPYPDDMVFEDCIAVVLRAVAVTPNYKIELVAEGEDCPFPDETKRWCKKDIVLDRFSYMYVYGVLELIDSEGGLGEDGK